MASIAQLVEHRTGIAEVTGSNPVEAPKFFSGFFISNCLNWKFTAMIIYHFHDSKVVGIERRVHGTVWTTEDHRSKYIHV